jgi:hypothetical protein
MALPAVAPRDAVAVRLDHLLQRARIVKPTSTIDPPLQVSELVPEDEPLLGDLEGEKEARWLAVDSAARRLFYAYLVSTSRSAWSLRLTYLGVHRDQGAGLCGHLEPARHSTVLWRSRYVGWCVDDTWA